MRIASLICMIGMCLGVHPLHAQSITPIPLHVSRGEGVILLPPCGIVPTFEGFSATDTHSLTQALRQLPSNQTTSLIPGQTCRLRLVRTAIYPLTKNEAYRLRIQPNDICIEAPTGAGAFYALQTLAQLFSIDPSGQYALPLCQIEDQPRFTYRGAMLDVSRHFFPISFLKKQIDALAHYKINHLHLHLTDAAGWRMEIKRYPALTEQAAWRTEANWKTWWNSNRQYATAQTPRAYGGYYTQDQLRDLVSYAQAHYITLVPEIEMPGHSEEVLAAYPHLSCSGQPYRHSDFCVGKDSTFTFLEEVLTEVMEVFPSPYIHIGGDEAGKQAWRSCPDCQKRMKAAGLSKVDELQNYLIRHIDHFLHRQGRKLLGWDEIVDGGLSPHATVMSWRGEEGGLKAAEQGQDAIMTPGKYCYLDAYQDCPLSEPEAIGGYLPLEKIYGYDPVPPTIGQQHQSHIKGVQANLWTEYVGTASHAEYMLYPRILALAEVAWSDVHRKNWSDFRRRALFETQRLKLQGYNPFDLTHEKGSRPQVATLQQHKAYAKSIRYDAPYALVYAAGGDTALTDGLCGDWTYQDQRWQGFISSQGIDVTIDLGIVETISSITATFMQVVGAEVFLPESVSISISTDGTHFHLLDRHQQAVDPTTPIAFQDFGWHGKQSARYIRYQAKQGKQKGWLFTDEIIVH